MFTLHDIPGRFPVGATTFVCPVRPSVTVGSGKLRHTPKGEISADHAQPALQLEEVAFTAYYPAQTRNLDGSREFRKGLDWLIRYVKSMVIEWATLRGFVIMIDL